MYCLSREEIKVFHCFIIQLDPTTTSISLVEHSGTSTSALNASISTPSSSWVIDSGASHYMTSMSSLFSSNQVCSVKDKVCIADGSHSSIVGKGDIVVDLLQLSSVFHVPNFFLNLLLSVILQSLLIVVSLSFPPIVCFSLSGLADWEDYWQGL